MKEDINFRIIKKLQERKYKKNVSDFLVDAIREEFIKIEQKRWNFKDTYDSLIEQHSGQEDLKK